MNVNKGPEVVNWTQRLLQYACGQSLLNWCIYASVNVNWLGEGLDEVHRAARTLAIILTARATCHQEKCCLVCETEIKKLNIQNIKIITSKN